MDTQKMLRSLLGRFVGEQRHTWLPVLTVPVFALAALMLWDGWRQSHAAAIGDQMNTYTSSAVEGVAKHLKTVAERFDAATREPMVVRSLRNGEEGTAVKTMNREWPELQAVTFYPPDLDATYAGEIARFGYGRLALIESVLASAGVRTLVIKDQGQAHLAVAGMVRDGGNVLAIAVGVLPLSDLKAAVAAATPPGGYLGIKQARFLVASHGADALAYLSEAAAQPVPGTDLRVVATAPTTDIGLLAAGTSYPVAGLLLVVGISALILIRRMPKPKAVEHGPTLAEATPEPEPGAARPAPRAPRPVTAALALDRSIFRAYDIRGVIGQTLDIGVARLIGRAIGSLMHEKGLREIVVGRDGRLSGPDLVNGLIAGLRTTGCDVIDIGQAPTPLVYFAGFHLRTGSGVAVTGSHNPPDYNGFKIVVGGETLSGDAIQALYARIAENELYDAPALGRLERRDVSGDYVERIANDIQVEQRLKVVVDCGNGVAGAIAPLVLESIGCEVIPLFCEVDGEFPNHHPDPSDPANLTDLINMVQRMQADIGVAFDGDGDRLGVVTRDGEVIYPDRLLMLFAEDVLIRNPGACILYDVKCTGHLAGHVLRHGGSPVMWKTGHSLIKAKMRETEAELAGEMSGHFFFRERWYGFDDGIYAAARLLEILGARAESPEEVFAAIPKGFSTPELKIPMVEGEHYAFVERFRDRAQFEGARVATIDGVRADWPDGWGLLRASNTTPVLVLRFDADTPEALARVQEVFRRQILALSPELPLPF
jgi:phosphomannomutase/phosphoglucomutase